MITTLSGPAGYIGQEIRDGFTIAMKQEGGKLGGVPIDLIVEDDGLNPGQGKRVAERFLVSEKIKLLTGIVFTNVATAVVPDVLQAGDFYVSANAAPVNFAGAGCNKNYFVASWLGESVHEATGALANQLGYKRMVLIAPNYQASTEALAGFKRLYKGTVVREIFHALNHTDFSAELAQIRADKPDAVFAFEPGGLGINFQKQYAQAGLQASIPLVETAPPFDSRVMAAIGDAAVGTNLATFWNADFDNATNKRFVSEFAAAYKHQPTVYAAQGYDTARLIGSALKAVGGDLSKADAFRAALLKADFESVRGKFKFGKNHHPIQDFYAAKVVKEAGGALAIKSGARIFEDHGDMHAKDCKL
jgi:branched-chain amino acid transport system substrate-binding protein